MWRGERSCRLAPDLGSWMPIGFAISFLLKEVEFQITKLFEDQGATLRLMFVETGLIDSIILTLEQ
jgi:hypothetical protein